MEALLNKQGFVTQWLLSGPHCEPCVPPEMPKSWNDQLGYEKALRAVFYPKTKEIPDANPALGFTGPCGEPWEFYYNHDNWFVDKSTFYSLLTTVRMDCATLLCSDKEQEVSATFWTYSALDVWVNGEKVMDAQPPVYKPINHFNLSLHLKKGENLVYVLLHNLGVRDSRSLFALQLHGSEGVTVAVPGKEQAEPYQKVSKWLNDLTCKNGRLTAASSAPAGITAQADDKVFTLEGEGPWDLPKGTEILKVSKNEYAMARVFELIENMSPFYLKDTSKHFEQYLKRVAEVESELRGNGVYFSVFNVLARLALGVSTPHDEDLLMADLDFVESRGDCSDFLVAGLIRVAHNYPISDRLKERMKNVFLNFRFWMDENGSDGMCFWSENHALMFYGTLLAAGEMYPDDVFVRSGRTGKEQAEIAAARCRDWLNDVERDGVEEFNSATYMPVTMTALLVLIDYAPEDISQRAGKLLDSLLRQLSMHVFKGSVISPQGRVYRDVIYPPRQTVQTLLNLIDPTLAYSKREDIWCAAFATTRYRFPEDLVEIMHTDATRSYVSGNARINLEKTKDYLLTSVCSPRDPEDAPTWVNLCFEPDADRSTNAYVKSLNERFHGTSVFEPGVYGYQQHLWYSALSPEAIVFVTHPGSSLDMDGMRPGYWYGNGVMPAVGQKNTVVGAVYQIPEDHPIRFTHTFWPAAKFDESKKEGHWLFGRVKEGYTALWCSGEQAAFDDVLTDCEYRCYDTNVAYCCMCGSKEKHGSFERFQEACRALAPKYDAAASTLNAGDLEVVYKRCFNKTQFI